MKKLCVIGDPVLHSKSPLIQNAMIAELGLDYIYSAVPVPRGGLTAWLDQARADGYVGFNATMPHKEALVPLMDELSESAAACASVNTVCIHDGQCYGYSTDGDGFVRSLADIGVTPRGKRIMLLGAGGAAKAVSLALLGAGVRTITVCNRTPDRARVLRALDPEVFRAAAFTPESLTGVAETADLLVNCTSLGMAGTGGQFSDFSFLGALPRSAAVCDLIYHPAETELLARARGKGHVTSNGLGMLIHQAICALEYFTGLALDSGRLRKVAERALGSENSEPHQTV